MNPRGSLARLRGFLHNRRMGEHEYVFAAAVEGLYLRALKDRLTPALRSELKAAGLDLDHVLPAYPLTIWEEALCIAARGLYPEHRPEEALAQLGRLLIEGYQQTAIGKAMFPLMKLLGPARVLTRMSRNFQSANNYTETRVNQLSPREAELWFNRVLQPAFYQGVLEAGLQAAGAQELAVELGSREGEGFTFRIRWS